jgi:uncharacterized protein (UPF0264 family)
MTALLASVRNLEEAHAAVAGGCDWLDLKEPSAGALGAVPLAVAEAVAARHAGQLPVSATIGDCWDTPAVIPGRVAALTAAGVPWVKVGVFASRLADHFTNDLANALRSAVGQARGLIAVCFVEDPPSEHAVALLASWGLKGVMLDTAQKTGGGLRQRLSHAQIAAFVTAARRHGLLVGLAGSLSVDDVAPLAALAPDYLGFRGALCEEGRVSALGETRVRAIKTLLAPAPATHPGPTLEENSHGLA